MHQSFRYTRLFLLGCVMALPSMEASAQAWPSKPIRLVVPFAPGGNTDIIARFIAPRMSQELGQNILIDNRGGAGSTLGTSVAAKSPPDGYTIVMVSTAHVINPAVRKSLPYDSINDFAAVTLVADVPNALVVHPSLPVHNVRQLVALAKSRPGELSFATPGRGTSTHLAVEMLASASGLKLLHVPYKGVGPATVDVVAGQADMIFAAMPAFIQYVRSGRLRMIAQATATRSPVAPEVPTMIEQGYKDFLVSSGFGMFAPAKTPKPVIDRLNAAVVKALQEPAVRSGLSSQGAIPVGNSPEEYDRYNRVEIEKWRKVAQTAGVMPE
ncbi:MAG: tripartite tricarboxylate transporter substrate binding protein [Burkholderiales bacterium]|nr:tripartite tricarboxylate transporter substrate binding protein [Burkholderiales bacterium]